MNLTPNTPTLWAQFRAWIGLPGTTRLQDALMDSTTVCRMARHWVQGEPDAQEMAEFGYPVKRREMEA